ncbi:PREDICTED: inositol monophosphatase 2-like [Diuraphis noxia]|uniref:inositol monophosphatase 2-like n=1 Tax=Diuraphis noxia TaxID=143948 RepID=UPI0007636529|nr:PREDICTED: inositol monophosphatase 2-like [Diuraphis noxia]
MSLCYLAMGAVDICSMKGLKCWDVAAGILIIREAGGIVLNLEGGQYKDIMNANITATCTEKLAENFFKLINEKF